MAGLDPATHRARTGGRFDSMTMDGRLKAAHDEWR